MTQEAVLRILEVIGIFLGAHITSVGFWSYVTRKREKKSLQTELLVGMAHDRIRWLGLEYIQRGWITTEEHENIRVYLYEPYVKLGGNGSAKRLMEEVDKLPIRAVKIDFQPIYTKE